MRWCVPMLRALESLPPGGRRTKSGPMSLRLETDVECDMTPWRGLCHRNLSGQNSVPLSNARTRKFRWRSNFVCPPSLPKSLTWPALHAPWYSRMWHVPFVQAYVSMRGSCSKWRRADCLLLHTHDDASVPCYPRTGGQPTPAFVFENRPTPKKLARRPR